jgi:hypothetical protein
MTDLSNNIITQPTDENENNINDILTKNNIGVRIKPETDGNNVIINICSCSIMYSK